MDYNPDEALKLKNQLCFPLYAVSRTVISAYTPYLKPLGLTYTQYITLMVLWEEDGLAVGELGARLHLDNGTLTPMLKKMETAGLITRRRRQEDERSVAIRLTDTGRALKEKVKDVPRRLSCALPLDDGEARELYRLLYKVLSPG